ncbi:MAG TPA: hypothetical protein VGJ30_13525 [Candidatus Angelobacter sp.]
MQQSHLGWLWQVLYFGGPIQIGEHGPILFVLYSIVPWVGVMALGYVFGRVMIADAPVRRKICLALGTAAIALFLLLRGFNLYGDPRPWVAPAPPGQCAKSECATPNVGCASLDNCQYRGSASRPSRSSKAAAGADMDFIPQHHKVSGFFAISHDDARADVFYIALPGKRRWSR